MCTFPLRCGVLVALIVCVVRAHAQIIDLNPNFDLGIEAWDTLGAVEWAPEVGYEGPSLHLASTSLSAATQCVLPNGNAVVATARVYSHCVGARLYLHWATKEDCSDTGAFPTSYFARSTAIDEWEPVTVVAPPVDGGFFLQIMMFNGGGCASGIYFDNVELQYDDIMSGDFDAKPID